MTSTTEGTSYQDGVRVQEQEWGHLAPEVKKKLRVATEREYRPDFDVLLSQNDTLKFLSSVPNGVFQLVVTSPPYNIGKPYEKRQELSNYLEWQKNVIRECVRVLRPGGSLCWQVGNYVENGEV